MNTIDITTLANYENSYVATSKDSCIIYASGKTISDVEEKLKKKKIKDAIIGFIPSVKQAVSPICL